MCKRVWLALAVATLIPTAALSDEPVRINGLKGNVEARLVGVKVSQNRVGNLIAKLETLDRGRQVIVISFPAHNFTTHERTLMEIIQGCADGGRPADADDWHRVKNGIEAVFSVPKEGVGMGKKSFEHCSLSKLRFDAAK